MSKITAKKLINNFCSTLLPFFISALPSLFPGRRRQNFFYDWVPLYRKAVYDAFYPYSNGEADEQLREINLGRFFMHQGQLDFDKLVEGYRTYVKRRGFRGFREKDEKGEWKQIR